MLLERVEQILYGEHGLASRLDADIPDILLTRGTVHGALYGSERSVMLGQEMVLPLGLLKNPIWDYVAMGHIHRHQALEADRPPPVVYSGSLERIDFGEEREDKGYVLAQVTRNHSSWAFRKLDARRFVTVSVTADGDDPTTQVVQEIERVGVQDAVVRVIIRTTVDRDVLIREQDVRRVLKDAFFVAAIVHDVVRPERLRLGGQQEMASLTPLQALERYLQVKQTPPERIAVLSAHAQSLLAQQE